jgi:TRAP-type C4-dicarboxylate transport system substrate-binding protein
MPKGVRKSVEDIVKGILEKQKERIQKLRAKDREKIRKLNAILAREKQARLVEAGAELEKLYREQGGSLDMKKVRALCEKYWPASAAKEAAGREQSRIKETSTAGKT